MLKGSRKIFFFLGVLLLSSCTKSNELPVTYRSYDEFSSAILPDSIKLLVEQARNLQPIQLEKLMHLDSSWNFQIGDSLESLHEPCKIITGEKVDLPHRIELPDRAIWYERQIYFSQKGVLTISADDGAQLYVNGQRIVRLYDTFFPIDTVGMMNVTIRVLNNAMAGGLRKVSFSTREQFRDYEELLSMRSRLNMLVKKVSLINDPTRQQVDLVRSSIEETNEKVISTAESAFWSFPYLTGPWLQVKDSTKWIINVLAEGNFPVILKYGTDVEDLSTRLEKEGKFVSFEIPNVSVDKEYYYQLLSGKTATPLYSFRKQSNSFSFNVWADSQSGWPAFRRNIANALPMNDAFGVGVGDLVSNGSKEEHWITFFDALSKSSANIPYYLIAGNHDYDGYYDDLDPSLYKEFTNNEHTTYFSWRYNNCAFIALDPNETFPIGIASGSEQFKWFRKQLESDKWKSATWHFILLHQPAYSQGWAGYHGDLFVRDLLEPIVESAKIDFIISGHTHNYERLLKNYGDQPVTFLVVGGAGGSLEPEESSLFPRMDTVIKTHHWGRFYVDNLSIRFEARNLENKVIDSFVRVK